MTRTLAGLPELEHFRAPAEREEALRELEAQAGSPTQLAYWMAVATIAVAVVATLLLVRFVSPRVPLLSQAPSIIHELLRLAAAAGAFWLTLRWLHRRGAAAELRELLLKRGIPVCRKCGYALRGLPPSSDRCPECGRAIDAEVKSMLDATSAKLDGLATPPDGQAESS